MLGYRHATFAAYGCFVRSRAIPRTIQHREPTIGTLYAAVSHAKGVFQLRLQQAANFAWLKAGARKAIPIVFDKTARPLFQQFWRWRRGLTFGVRAIVIDAEGGILLVRQTYAAGWTLPGGGVELGETLERSLARELDEEAGVAMQGRPELMGIYDNQAAYPGDHIAVYVVRNWSRIRVPKANLEIAECAFFGTDALPDTIVSGARRRIEEMLGRRELETTW